jgi:hypothetical protein
MTSVTDTTSGYGNIPNLEEVLSGNFAGLQRCIRLLTANAVEKILAYNNMRPLCSRTPVNGCRHLVTSQNRPNNMDGWLVTAAPKIPEDKVTDRAIRSRLFHFREHITKEVDFNQPGYCAGMSTCFLLYYFHSKNHFSDPCRHMEVLGWQFKEGAGVLPILLQRLYSRKGKVMDLEIGKQHSPGEVCSKFYKQLLLLGASTGVISSETRKKTRAGRGPRKLICKPLQEWRNAALSKDIAILPVAAPVGELKVPSTTDATLPMGKNSEPELIRQLQHLETGTYFTNMSTHSTAYVKISAEQSFFFDPNSGIFEITGPNQGRELCKRMIEAWERLPRSRSNDYYCPVDKRNLPGEMWIIRVNPRSCLVPIATKAGPWVEQTPASYCMFGGLTALSRINLAFNPPDDGLGQLSLTPPSQPEQPSDTGQSSFGSDFWNRLASLSDIRWS